MMNQKQIIKDLNHGAVFYGIPEKFSIDYTLDDEDNYIVDCGIRNINLPKGKIVYFLKSPANNEYIMISYIDENTVLLLFHHHDIHEMIDFNECDFSDLHVDHIDKLKNIQYYADCHGQGDELEFKRSRII